MGIDTELSELEEKRRESKTHTDRQTGRHTGIRLNSLKSSAHTISEYSIADVASNPRLGLRVSLSLRGVCVDWCIQKSSDLGEAWNVMSVARNGMEWNL